MSWCNLDLTFDLVKVTISLKIFYFLDSTGCRLKQGDWLGVVGVGVHHHGVTFAWGVWATQVSVLLQGRGHLLCFISRLGWVPGPTSLVWHL